MSYDTVVDQIKRLPECCLEDVSKYLDFIFYKYMENKMEYITESEEVFENKLKQGFLDMEQGNVFSLNDAFSKIKRQFE